MTTLVPQLESPEPDLSVGAAQNWLELEVWCRKHNFLLSSQIESGFGLAYAVTSASGQLSLRPGSQVARWEGIRVYLGFPPVLIEQQPFLRHLEFHKTLAPLLVAKPARPQNKNRVIAIDPGHGGVDSGTRSALNGESEKDFTLDWALRLRSVLLRDGFEPVLTHVEDTDMSVSDRVAAAEACNAAVFVSLHFNASGGGEDQAGLETYCLTPTGMPSSITRGYEDNPATVFPNNSFDSENLQLACAIHRSLLRVNGSQDRGVRRARFLSVLRGQRRPAVLVEGGYLSNPTEARLIGTVRHRQDLAEALAAGLRQFLGTAAQ